MHCEQRQFFSFCEKSRVSSFQVAAKSIFDIAAPALVGRVHTLHYIWQGRFVCSQIKAGCLYHFGGQAEVRCFVKEIPSKTEYNNKGGEREEFHNILTWPDHPFDIFALLWHHLLGWCNEQGSRFFFWFK